MDTDGETLPSPPLSDDKKRRGRPSAGPESHKQRVERLQAELKEAQAALKLTEEKRAFIVGHAAIRYARRNTEFSRQLSAALRAEVKAKAERGTIADLLLEDTSPPMPASDNS